MAELNNFLTFALPFGTRVDTSISNAKNSFKAQPPDKNASQKVKFIVKEEEELE